MRAKASVLLALLALVGLTSCLPVAPVGGRNVCEFIRYRVFYGSIPLDYALQHYPECAPFEVKDD